MVGVFVVDGGNATGLAWGIFDDQARTTEAAMLGRLYSGSDTINRRVIRNKVRLVEDPHSDSQQILAIYRRFLLFKSECVHQHHMHADTIHLVIEDFILLPGPHAGGKDGVASARIGWGVVGVQIGMAEEYKRTRRHLHVSEPIFQAPSCMAYASDEKLKKWGIWEETRGDHERAAWKHIAYFLNKRIR